MLEKQNFKELSFPILFLCDYKIGIVTNMTEFPLAPKLYDSLQIYMEK